MYKITATILWNVNYLPFLYLSLFSLAVASSYKVHTKEGSGYSLVPRFMQLR